MSDYNPDTDPRSSNSLIRAYLASKGVPLNGENVRRALEANNANAGLIPGLVNSLPSTEAAARGRSGGGRGIPTPPIPPGAPSTLPDSAPGSETRVGGTGGSPNTSAAPTDPASEPPSGSELNSALIAAAIAAGAGGSGLLMRQLWQNRSPTATSAPAPVVPAVPAPAAPPPGPRIDTQFDPQGKPTYSGGVRGQPTQAPPITVQTGPPSQPIQTPGQFTAANPDASIPVPEPAVVPAGPAPAPLPRQPIQSPDQFRAANPATANVPPAEVAPKGTRGRAPRVRVRVPL